MTPSERLLSLRSRPGGSFAAGNEVLCMALQTMSLTMLCRLILAALWRHDLTVDASTFHLHPIGTEMRLADADTESHSSGDHDGLVRHS